MNALPDRFPATGFTRSFWNREEDEGPMMAQPEESTVESVLRKHRAAGIFVSATDAARVVPSLALREALEPSDGRGGPL